MSDKGLEVRMLPALLATLLLLLPPLARAEAPRGLSPASSVALQRALSELERDRLFEALELSASVRCAGSGDAHALSADRLANPASGAKLLSTSAALALLGPEHRFVTSLEGELDAKGTLTRATLVAGGDPGLETRDLARLAEAARAAGVTSIAGDLVIDLGHFAGTPTPPAFDQKKADAAYRAEVPAFAVGSGAVTVTVKPAKKVGAPVEVLVNPTAATITVDNKAKTLEGKRLDKLVIESRAGPGGATRIVVSGGLGIKAPNQGTRKRIHEPAAVAADLFVRQLERQGVRMTGKVRLVRDGDRPKPSRTIARVEGRTVAELVHIINKTSNNFTAEALFKQLGGATGPGTWGATWERAVERASAALLELGLTRGSFLLVNGSGLYDATKVTADAMTRLIALQANGTRPEHAAFRDSLAIAGRDGTLQHRLKPHEGRIFGKTGTLDNALSLAGYLERDGCRLVFAVMVNGAIGKKSGAVIRRIDEFVGAIASQAR